MWLEHVLRRGKDIEVGRVSTVEMTGMQGRGLWKAEGCS